MAFCALRIWEIADLPVGWQTDLPGGVGASIAAVVRLGGRLLKTPQAHLWAQAKARLMSKLTQGALLALVTWQDPSASVHNLNYHCGVDLKEVRIVDWTSIQ